MSKGFFSRLKRFLSKPEGVLTAGTVLAVAVFCLALTPLVNPPQCPDDYTQQQVDASNCIIGANIGGGLVVFLAIAIAAAAMLAALVMAAIQRLSVKGERKDKLPKPEVQRQPEDSEVAKWPHPFLAAVLVVTLFYAGQVVSAVLVGILSLLTGEAQPAGGSGRTLFGSPVLLQFAYALLAYGTMLVSLVWFWRRRGLGLGVLGLKRPHPSDAGWAVLAFVGYIATYTLLVSVISPLVPGLDVEQRQDTGFAGAGGLSLLLVGFTLVVLAPVTEEILMRGFLFGSLRRRWPFWSATLVTSVIFGFFHLWGGEAGAGPIWIAAIDTFVLSFALCYLREKTGRLWASIALHIVKNAIAFTYLFIIASS